MHIIKIEYGTRDYQTMVDMIEGAVIHGRDIRLSADGDGVMVKVGIGGLWTAHLGSTEGK